MTQIEYYSEMKKLFDEHMAAKRPIQQELSSISAQRSDVKQRIIELHITEQELDRRYLQLSDRLRQLKEEYNEARYAIMSKRYQQ